ncbi:hypothetical protein ADK67_26475 [Saccharothrix sp. NRRL B-16348]|nr:hypothetical protein ADK67_26475 [Saccharothrix sp. NRRL B-16348]
MSGRFPGARDLDEFWAALVAGREGITHFTEAELAEAGVSADQLADPDYVRSAGVIDGPALFDADFFGFTRAEAETTDPAHRLLLESSWQALEDAGHVPADFGGRVGVFAGTATSGYRFDRIARHPRAGELFHPLQVAVGNDPDMPALRVSYKLDLTGPSMTIQTACSSSLVAVHMACQSLLLDECDLALAGGAAVRLLDRRGYRYDEGGILSRDGRCRPFDAAAGGTVVGDGVGVVVLRRLEDALADGDHVRAVILGSTVNNDGAAKVGFTAPSPDGQAAAIAEALAVAEVDPATVGYVEAHGTGTSLGDPIEVRALTDAFGPGASAVLGSVKSSIGHLDAAAGVAGLIKAVLALEHRHIPGTLHFERPNPETGLAASPFRVSARGQDWPASDHPPRAGVSSFGIGGTNAHVVLEAAPDVPAADPGREWRVLPLSARTPAALDAATARLAEHLRTRGELAEAATIVRHLSSRVDVAEAAAERLRAHGELADVAHTLQVGRTAFAHRRAVVCRDLDGAVEALEASSPATRTDGPPSVVFLFPGQGSQYPGMGAELYEREPVFRAAMDECAELLGWDVRQVAFARDEGSRERLRRTAHTQPAMFCLDYSLARLLGSWGVRPDAMLGHSLGEFVAACLAGVFTLRDALRVVEARAGLMQDLPPGRMISVALDEAGLADVLDGHGTIAGVNAPNACVVAGTDEEIAEVARRLDARGIAHTAVETSHAFHSPMVDPALPGLAEVVRGIALDEPAVPFLSNVTGTWITDEQATDPDYWVSHARQPVRFADGVTTLLATDRLMVEVGPGRALSGPARRNGNPVVTLLPKGFTESEALARGLADLWRHGVPVDWAAVRGGERRRRTPLPTYPFERREYLLPRTEEVERTRRHDPARWTYVPAWRPAPLTGEPVPRAAWLVFEDATGLARRLTEALRAGGHVVTAVRRGREFSRDAEGFVLDGGRREHFTRLVDELRRDGGLPQRVVHAWSVTDADRAPFEDVQDAGLFTLLHLAQALAEAGDAAAVRCDVLVNDLHDVVGDRVRLPERATVHAATVLTQEFAGSTYRCVDVPLDADTADLVAELTHDQREPLVAHRAGRRWTRSFTPVRLEAAQSPWRPGGGYLVTGGSGTAGPVFAEHLARAGARVVLVGDDEEPPGVGSFVRADLTDRGQAARAVAVARAELGRIRGVVHADGARGSGLSVVKTRAEALPVLAGRVVSTLALHELVADDEPDFFLLASSTTGVVGGIGQLENCAAAAFLDAFAHATGAVSVDWGQWDRDDWLERQVAGMPELRERFERTRRDHGIPAADGLAIAESVLHSRLTQVLVSTVDFEDLVADQAEQTAAVFADVPRAPAGDWDPVAVWPDDEVARGVGAVWREVLGVPSIGPDDDFHDLGGNSLFAIQVMARLRQVHGDMPASVIFEAPTVSALAAAIRAHQAVDGGPDEFEALLREVESLSPEEAEARLRGHDG